jgi:hypothetical protein
VSKILVDERKNLELLFYYAYFNQSIGMSWYNPLGKTLLMEIGKTFEFSSATAMEIVLLYLFDESIKIGAPRESCNDLAPIILARSNRVYVGGPIKSWLS